MDLNRTFLLFSFVALSACEHSDINGYRESESSITSSSLKSDERIKFLENYNRLYHEVDGAWFSFGDEKQLRKSLSELKILPMAQNIISHLPDHIRIGSTYFLRDDLSGGYVPENGSVNVASQQIAAEQQKRNSNQPVTAEVLFHELYHADQDRQGLVLLANASIDEIIISQRLIEAEAHAWTNVLQEIRKASSNGTYHLSQNDIKHFIKKDLIGAKQEKMAKEGLGEMPDWYLENFKEKDPTYCFQQSLIACHGNLEKACHRLACRRMRFFLDNQEPDWTITYNKQAVLMIKKVAKKGLLSQTGEKNAYNKMVNYYTQKYGLSLKEIQKVPATKELMQGIDEIIQTLDSKKGWLEDKQRGVQNTHKHQIER